MSVRVRTTVSAAVGIVACLVLLSAPAQGYSFEYNVATNPSHGTGCKSLPFRVSGDYSSGGCFQADGDVLWVADNNPDGESVAVQWKTNYGRAGLCRDTHGVHAWSYVRCNKNFKENKSIKFRAGKCNQTKTNPGRLPSDYHAWGKWTPWLSVKTGWAA